MELNRSEIPLSSFYKVIIGSVVPRPIAWVSTLNSAGVPNLAPYSFFNIVCKNPPTILFCPGVRGTDGQLKDSYVNVRDNKEFVVNIVSEDLAEMMNKTATELPAEVDEFEYAGLSVAPSTMISAPRVAESPVSFECKVSQIIDVGDGNPGSGWVVLGEVVHIHVADEVMLPNYRIDLDKLNPIGRLSGRRYARTTDRFEMKRESSQVLPR